VLWAVSTECLRRWIAMRPWLDWLLVKNIGAVRNELKADGHMVSIHPTSTTANVP